MALSEEQIENRLRENINQVKERIAAARKRAGQAFEPMLVAVTKYVEPEIARMVVAQGVMHLGESRPQALWKKAEALADLPVHWHLIGQLQRNKVARTLPLVKCIHSVDSWRLLEAIAGEGVKQNRVTEVLLEVNVSKDASKSGMRVDELEPLVAKLGTISGAQVQGLMTMASLTGGIEVARRNFAVLRELRDRLRGMVPPNVDLGELSMGMSEDFEVAIEEGATIVRVGSALFEGVV